MKRVGELLGLELWIDEELPRDTLLMVGARATGHPYTIPPGIKLTLWEEDTVTDEANGAPEENGTEPAPEEEITLEEALKVGRLRERIRRGARVKLYVASDEEIPINRRIGDTVEEEAGRLLSYRGIGPHGDEAYLTFDLREEATLEELWEELPKRFEIETPVGGVFRGDEERPPPKVQAYRLTGLSWS